MKQINLTILLTILMSMVGAKAFAYDVAVENEDGNTIYYNYINNSTELEVTYRTTSYKTYSGNIKIPETVTILNKTRSVTSIGSSAFRYCSGLTSVNIPASVTSIGNSAFYKCDGLTSITIPSSVTSIGDYAFYECSGLTSITIPSSVTSIGDYAFEYCSGLTSITISEGVTSIGRSAFASCRGLTSITIPASMTSIGNYAFNICSGLTSVTIFSSVTSIGSFAFAGCSGLKKVIVKDLAAWCGISFDSNDSNPLYYAKHLYSDEDTEITYLVIPEGVTSIGNYAFEYCNNLTSVTIPSSVTSIGNYAFEYCSNLTSITIPASVTSIGNYAFHGCSSLTSITIPASVTSIGDYAFYECSGFTSVTIPSSVTSIGSYAFDKCDNLADFVSLIQEPFKVSNIVSNFIYNNGTLYVPQGTIEKYKATNGWKNFVWIEEGMPMSIKQPNANGADATETQRYTIDGDVINTSRRGINIIKMSNGTVKKVIVK